MLNIRKRFKCTVWALTSLMFTIPFIATAEVGGGVDDFGMEDHSKSCDRVNNIQHISVADFNGDGIVTEDDIDLIKAQMAKTLKEDGTLDNTSVVKSTDPNYSAFFDINNDGKVDKKDLELAIADLGKESQLLDQQIASVYHFAMQYNTLEKAIRAGFVPFTQEYQNHGFHLLRFPDPNTNYDPTDPTSLPIIPSTNVLDGTQVLGEPEGLNFDRFGNLVGVFYYVGPDIIRLMGMADPTGPYYQDSVAHFTNWYLGDFQALTTPGELGSDTNLQLEGGHGGGIPKPVGFTDQIKDGESIKQDHWHFHQAICQRNVWSVYMGAQALRFNPAPITVEAAANLANSLDTRQCDLPGSCSQYNVGAVLPGQPDAFFMPKFFMLHVWLFTQNNPCGIMWGTHEDVSYNDVTNKERLDIASEGASFVIQGTTEFLTGEVDENGDPIQNIKYRELCLNKDIVQTPMGQMPLMMTLDYEGLKGLIADTLPQYKETAVCPPLISGATKDEGCTGHPSDGDVIN